MLDLNLPGYKYFLTKREGKLYIEDIIRGKNILLTPEEWVRQHFINFLISNKGVPKKLIAAETGLKVNRLNKRTDILVYTSFLKPLLLVECKASHIQLNEECLHQLTLYNSEILSPFIGLTNGMVHYYWLYNQNGDSTLLSDIPNYDEMKKLVIAK